MERWDVSPRARTAHPCEAHGAEHRGDPGGRTAAEAVKPGARSPARVTIGLAEGTAPRHRRCPSSVLARTA